MTEQSVLPPVGALKAQAKNLRARLAEDGDFISHSESLEIIAAQYGRRDWNTLRAEAARRQSSALKVGARLNGRYLRQPFTGEVISLSKLPGDKTRLAIRFDAPVDVVTFESFSAFRTRVTAVVGADWTSPRKTSDGAPHLAIESVE